jgi:hypothetical protein
MLGVFCLAGIRQRRPELWWMWALSLIPWCLWLITDKSNLHGPASATVIFTAVVIAVDSIGSRLRAQHSLATQTERAEAERAQRAVLEERTRMARELHDVVAHHMSLIAVRAETAPYRLPGLPESARDEFSSLSEVAREALASAIATDNRLCVCGEPGRAGAGRPRRRAAAGIGRRQARWRQGIGRRQCAGGRLPR